MTSKRAPTPLVLSVSRLGPAQRSREILVSAGLYEKVTGAFMQHSYKEYCGTMDSDHWPVVVDFEGFSGAGSAGE